MASSTLCIIQLEVSQRQDTTPLETELHQFQRSWNYSLHFSKVSTLVDLFLLSDTFPAAQTVVNLPLKLTRFVPNEQPSLGAKRESS